MLRIVQRQTSVNVIGVTRHPERSRGAWVDGWRAAARPGASTTLGMT